MLKCDSLFSITPNSLKEFQRLERRIYPIYESIKYPERAWENGISGLVIVKLDCFKNDTIINIVFEKCPDPIFKDPITKSINKHKNYILNYISEPTHVSFYIPFRFEIDQGGLIKDMNDTGVIRITNPHFIAPSMLL